MSRRLVSTRDWETRGVLQPQGLSTSELSSSGRESGNRKAGAAGARANATEIYKDEGTRHDLSPMTKLALYSKEYMWATYLVPNDQEVEMRDKGARCYYLYYCARLRTDQVAR